MAVIDQVLLVFALITGTIGAIFFFVVRVHRDRATSGDGNDGWLTASKSAKAIM